MGQVHYRITRNIILGFTITTVLMLQVALHGHLFFKTDKYPDARNSSTTPIDIDITNQYEGHEIVARAALSIDEAYLGDPKILFRKTPSELIMKNNYGGKWTSPNPSICSKKENITLVILITTAVHHFELRESVRTTWLSHALRNDIAYAFVIGDMLLSQYNASVIEKLNEEMELYGDFAVANFKDTYRNLVIKTVYMLGWVAKYCSHSTYFLKTDDDVFISLPNIMDFIDTVKNEDEVAPKIYGQLYVGNPVRRNVTHKHYVPYEVYPRPEPYPNFTSGPAYLMRTRLVPILFKTALDFPVFPLEDVLVTGLVATNLKIPRVHVAEFVNEVHDPSFLEKCDLISMYAGMTNGTTKEMYDLWYKYVDGHLTCNITGRPRTHFADVIDKLWKRVLNPWFD